MAVRINPCFRCPLAEGCEHRDVLRRRVSGIGARSVEFPCDRLGAEMRKGRRIEIRHPVIEKGGGDYGVGIVHHMVVPATITSVSGGYRFSCVVDPIDAVMEDRDEKDANKCRFRRTMRHFRIIRFLDEPDATFCQQSRVLRGGKCDTPDGACDCRRMAEDLGTGWAA